MNVELKLWLKDLVSDGIRKMEAVTRSSFGRIGNSVSGATSHINGLGSAAQRLNTPFVQAGNQASKAMGQMGKAADDARQRVERLNSSLNSGGRRGGGLGIGGFAIGSMLGGLGANIAMQGGRKLMSEAGDVMQGGMEMGALQQQFQVMAGADKGKALFGDLRKWVKDSVFGPEQYKNARTMMAFGIAPEEIMKDMKMLGDVSMGDVERMQQLTLAFSQTRSAGKLMGDDLRQYVAAGFNPLEVMSKKTGKSMAQLRDEMSAGKISAEQVVSAFVSATSEGGKFYGMLENMAKTPYGKLAKMKGSWEDAKAGFGEKIAPSIGKVLDSIAPILDKMPSFFARITPGITDFFDGVTAAMPKLEEVGRSLVSALAPIGKLAVSSEIRSLGKSVLGLANELLKTLKPAIELIVAVLRPVTKFVSGMVDTVTQSLQKVTGFFSWYIDALKTQFGGGKKEEQWKPLTKLPQLPKALKASIAQDKKNSEKQSSPAEALATQAEAITGGGKKMITINFNRPAVEQTFHVGSMREAAEVGLREFMTMYLQVINGTLARI